MLGGGALPPPSIRVEVARAPAPPPASRAPLPAADPLSHGRMTAPETETQLGLMVTSDLT